MQSNRQNYATAVNTQVNITTFGSRYGTGRTEVHAERGEIGTFRLILLWNASCLDQLSRHASDANATLHAHEQRGPASS
jgi:hypothetical protein